MINDREGPDLQPATSLYPVDWERHLVLHEAWRVFARPIREDDESLVRDLLQHVTKHDLRLRFFASIRQFSHAFLLGLTRLDYARAMAFIAFDESTNETLGVVRIHRDASLKSGEYAILLRSDLKGQGLGWALMKLMIEYSKAQGLMSIHGQILQENTVMLTMCRELGFVVKVDPDDRGLCNVTLVF